MSKITLDNLSDNLKDLIGKNGITEEQIVQIVEENISGDLDLLNTNEKGSLVAAINELFQSANNGKELIANAIGEPLNAEDTFSAMSTDINGLLSTFKTNMMNNGVTVESGDKFKALIDKIATLADNEGKGIQMASGTFSGTLMDIEHQSIYAYGIVVSNLSFRPNLIIANAKLTDGNNYNAIGITTDFYDNNVTCAYFIKGITNTSYEEGNRFNFTNALSDNGFRLAVHDVPIEATEFTWYAIGVGEEDTTLRDSLASVLEDEGVEVLEEDTMADLIVKTDEEFDRKNANSGGLNTPIPENTNVCIYCDVNAVYYGGSEWAAEGANLIEGFEMPVSGTVRFETVLLCAGPSGTKLYYYINDSLYSTDNCTTSNTPTMTIPNTGIWDALTYDNDDMQAYLIQKELTVKKGDVIRVFADNSSPNYYYGFSLYTAALRCSF